MPPTDVLGDLQLDRPVPTDAPDIHRIYSDARTWTHCPLARFTDRDQSVRLVSGWIDGWERDGLSTWIVRDGAQGTVLGNVGCMLRADTFWNLGYRLAPESHNRGVASRVSAHAIAQARQLRPDIPVVAYLLEHNRPSARVAEKVGLALRYRGPDSGNPDPTAVRLVYADRSLSPTQLKTITGL